MGSHVDLVAESQEEDSDWEADRWNDGEKNLFKEWSFMGFVTGDVTKVRDELHEEGGHEEESENGSNEAECFEIFFRDESLILFVHCIGVILVYKSINCRWIFLSGNRVEFWIRI